MLAHITVDKKAVRAKSFLYRVPKKMKLELGSLVLVPFHGQRVAGIVNSVQKNEEKRFRIKEIESLIYPQSLLEKNYQKLANFIAKKYFAPLSAVIFVMLPHYLRKIKRAETIVDLVDPKKIKKIKIKNLRSKKHHKYFLFDPQNRHALKIYQRAIKATLRRNESVLFLAPDLDLAIIKEIKKLSPKSIILNKDNQTDKEIFIKWQKIKEGKSNLIIGSHLALFSPVANLGLIIIHQENDPFYKNDQLPKYNLREVAIMLAILTRANIILEAQIPSLESIMAVKKGIYKLIPYKNFDINLGLKTKTNPIKIIDLKNERGLLSLLALRTIENNLKNKKRTLLFLNRKGFSRFLICQDCGYTKHLNPEETVLAICPDCSGTNIREHSFGTRRLEFEMKKLYPKARIIRLDKENPKTTKADIVIATSYIFKLNFTFDTVIIILAEIGLSLPDFRSEENLFYTLFRALRLAKEKIIQTFYPEHKVIKYFLEDNLSQFANDQLRQRKENNYPPFSTMIRLTYSEENALQKANKLAKTIKQLNQTYGSPNEILGPAKVFIQTKNKSRTLHSKVRDKSKIEIILKGKNPYPLLSLVPENWKVDVDPIELLK